MNGSTYVGNAAGAKSQGVELSIQSKPVSGLTIGAWVTWDDAVLTQTVPGADIDGEIFGFAGDRLPNTPRFSGNLSVDYNFPLASDIKGFVGGALSYVGDRRTPFRPRVRNDRICLRTRSWTCTLAQHITPGQRISTLTTLLISAALSLEVLGISFLTASITSSRARSDCLFRKRFRTRLCNAFYR